MLEREQLETKIGKLAASGPLYQPDRFKQVPLSASLAEFIKENPQGDTRIRLNRLLLEAAYPKELARSLGGVYPDREINTPPASEALRCTQEYMADAQRRLRLNQLEPGEDVVELPDGKVQINGQVSVMAINGLLTKIIFDQNPGNEFYVEESAPIKWMYPYLTPFGIIMKLNRQPPAELTEDMVRRDHEFWTRYSERLIGNWITYDTSIQDIVAWVERVYQRRDFTGFKGDRKFVRDDDAQKVFSKLRNAIAGLYNYRLFFMAKAPAEQQRLLKETEFALRQAFAFCPYNIEVVGRYVQFLANFHRFDEALLIANTCLKLDPNNEQVAGIIKTIRTWKDQAHARGCSPTRPSGVSSRPFKTTLPISRRHLTSPQPASSFSKPIWRSKSWTVSSTARRSITPPWTSWLRPMPRFEICPGSRPSSTKPSSSSPIPRRPGTTWPACKPPSAIPPMLPSISAGPSNSAPGASSIIQRHPTWRSRPEKTRAWPPSSKGPTSSSGSRPGSRPWQC